MFLLVYLLAFVWGGIWAAFLQFVPLGQFLARKRTWITVVIGVGVDLLLTIVVVPWEHFVVMGTVVTLSGVGIIARSLYNEWGEWGEWLDVFKDAGGQQSHLGLGGYHRRLSGGSRGVAEGDGPGQATDGSNHDDRISDSQ